MDCGKPGFRFNQLSLWGQPTPTGFGSDAWHVEIIDREQANDIIRKNHYSGTVYNGTSHSFGVFIDGCLKGVLQWGAAMNPASGGSIVPGMEIHHWRELNRMWLDDSAPRNSESRAISYTIKTLRRLMPGLKMVQSFADERCGGLGVVYQACSFGYYGEHTSVFWELDGEWFHNIAMTVRGEEKARRKGAVLLQANSDRAARHELRQFRYLRFFDKRFAERCLLKPQSYPKRLSE